MNDKYFTTQITKHAYDRIKERLETMTSNGDITVKEATNLEDNLHFVLNNDFDNHTSYGISLGTFEINPDSALVTQKHKTGTYYEINSLDYQDVIRDSTGNELWAIIRNGRLITAFLRKTIQRHTAEKPRKQGGLGVDVVVDNIRKYLLEHNY